jgi:tricorn protease
MAFEIPIPFTEGYRELRLGTVVGEPTAGWIIFTGSRGLVDGTQVRMPGTFIRDNRGQNMELNPRPVDVHVERPPASGTAVATASSIAPWRCCWGRSAGGDYTQSMNGATTR